MNPKTTLGLLGVLVVLGAIVYWTELRPGAIATPTPTATASKILDFQPSRASELGITWSGKQLTIRKQGEGQWQITQPEAEPADGYVVESVLAALSALSTNRSVVVKTADLGPYGLVEPPGTIAVTLGPGETQRLIVGGPNPDKSSYYTRRPWAGGEGEVVVFMLPAQIAEGLKGLVDNPPKSAVPTPGPTP